MSAHAHGDPRSLRIALVATAAIAIVECAGGFLSHSIALLTDSAHVALDVVALFIALAAFHLSARPANARQTFGFARTEILAAFLNGGLLLGVTVVIVVEAIRRLMSPSVPHGAEMAAFAAVGFCVNLALALMLLRSSKENLNIRAAFMHIAGDVLAGLGVFVGGLLIWAFGWWVVDPVLSLAIAGVIVFGVLQIIREAVDVLLESAPAHVDVAALGSRIRAMEGVAGIHDLHVWTLGTGSHALSAHVLLPDRRISDASAILRRIDRAMRDDFDISHVTVQFECESCVEDDRIVCTQLGPQADAEHGATDRPGGVSHSHGV
jgi:cobalt-zinc-cadmium efflux system protein